jgi:hypothetical protein
VLGANDKYFRYIGAPYNGTPYPGHEEDIMGHVYTGARPLGSTVDEILKFIGKQ